MREYHVTIKAKLEAQNFESAQKKVASLQQLVEKKAKWTEVHMKGERG